MISGPDDDGHSRQKDWREEFPLGDGTADTQASVYCPYCNETVQIAIDPGGGSSQEYVEDCEVCCQPWSVSVRYGGDGSVVVKVTALDQ